MRSGWPSVSFGLWLIAVGCGARTELTTFDDALSGSGGMSNPHGGVSGAGRGGAGRGGHGGVPGSAGQGGSGGTFSSAGSAGQGGEAGSPCLPGLPGCPPPFCGDGFVTAPEACDDGNTKSGDGCSATCRWEARSVASGGAVGCAIGYNGVLKCWGFNDSGILGQGDTRTRGARPGEMGDNLQAVDLGTGRRATAVAIGYYSVCAILEGGSVKCWGENGYGALGLGDTRPRGENPGEMGDALPAVNLGTGRTATAVAVGYHSACALLDHGSVKCWGENSYGELGLGDVNARGDQPGEMGDNLPAVDLGSGRTATGISVALGSACAVLDTGAVKCWGSNGQGQLGLGDNRDRGEQPGQMGDNLPAVDLGPGQLARAVVTGGDFSGALLADGTTKWWGDNSFGQLGLGDANNRGAQAGQMGALLPTVSLGTGRSARAIPTETYFASCALLDNLSVKCWGNGENGQLGLGDTLDRGSKPGQLGDSLPALDFGTGRTVKLLAAGDQSSCVILDDGTIKCWGLNNEGQLGLGDTNNRGDAPGEMGDNLPTVNVSF